MTWEELCKKAKELGYTYLKERGVAQLYKDFECCRINFIEQSGNIVVDIPQLEITYSSILCRHISVNKMYSIMEALG